MAELDSIKVRDNPLASEDCTIIGVVTIVRGKGPCLGWRAWLREKYQKPRVFIMEGKPRGSDLSRGEREGDDNAGFSGSRLGLILNLCLGGIFLYRFNAILAASF